MRWLLVAVLLVGCKTTGPDTQLTGDPAAALKKLIGHDAITISEKRSIYLSENPPDAYVKCHEAEHRLQFKLIADALVGLGVLEDIDISRAAAALAIYGIDAGVHGYFDNRFEKGARKACEHLLAE